MEDKKTNEIKNDFSGNQIKPLLDKKGNPMSNVKICKSTFKILDKLKKSKKTDDNILYSKIIHGNENIYNWLKEVSEIEDEDLANNHIKKTLITIM